MGGVDKWEARNRVLVVYDIWLCMHLQWRSGNQCIWYGMEFLFLVYIDGAPAGNPYSPAWIWLYSNNPRNIPLSMQQHRITGGQLLTVTRLCGLYVVGETMVSVVLDSKNDTCPSL